MDIREDDLTHPQTLALLRLHLAGMQANSPEDNVFALDLAGLRQPDITVWTSWRDGQIAGIAALRQRDAISGEIKSMRTHPDHLRRGVAARLLTHVLATGMSRGLSHFCLETGTGASFEPALALYRRFGFLPGPAFQPYQPSAFNQFFHLETGD